MMMQAVIAATFMGRYTPSTSSADDQMLNHLFGAPETYPQMLWKIAVGLEIPFHELLGSSSAASVLVLRAGDALTLRSTDGRTESRLLSPGGASGDTEVYELRLLSRAVHRSEPHARGTTETLVVLTGAVRLVVGAETYELSSGDSVFFHADVPHSYENPGTREARFLDVIRYERT